MQWIDTPFTTKVCPSFEYTVVFCFGSVSSCYWFYIITIVACASDKIDVVVEAGPRLIRPASDSVRVGVLLWFQEVWGIDWEWL